MIDLQVLIVNEDSCSFENDLCGHVPMHVVNMVVWSFENDLPVARQQLFSRHFVLFFMRPWAYINMDRYLWSVRITKLLDKLHTHTLTYIFIYLSRHPITSISWKLSNNCKMISFKLHTAKRQNLKQSLMYHQIKDDLPIISQAFGNTIS